MTSKKLLSWGNYPFFPQTSAEPAWSGKLVEALRLSCKRAETTIAYGAGRSYGDVCLAQSDHVLLTRSLDRFLRADWESGVLAAQAGVTLGEVLELTIPRGWFLPVTPGTKYASLGGAVANDVHGKNHHRRGTFGQHVRSFGLLRSDLGSLICSRHENAELFGATIGGLGLTGVIDWVEIQLTPIRSSQLDASILRFDNLDEFFALSDELDAKHEFCVGWIDCTATGAGAGRGIYTVGDFSDRDELVVASRRKITVPFTPPLSLINGLSVRAFNFVHWHSASKANREMSMDYDSFFYPLDGVLRWNRLYGRRGFQQYQALLPEGVARDAVGHMLEEIARSGMGSFLAVIKRCGGMVSPGWLSFPSAGTTLAIDFAQSERLGSVLFPRLDAIVREAAGRLYPAKDAHMTGVDFRRNYPEWERLEMLRDPALMSRFWSRVSR